MSPPSGRVVSVALRDAALRTRTALARTGALARPAADRLSSPIAMSARIARLVQRIPPAATRRLLPID